jgi:predicted DNA-binding protein YlxM (UPF0122 family)
MSKKTIKNEYTTIAEIAKKAGVSRIAVFRKLKRLEVPHEKVGGVILIRRRNMRLLGY